MDEPIIQTEGTISENNPPEMILECIDLTKKYADTLALDNLRFKLPAGRVIGLLGPNGSGKTTLLKIIAGLLTPNSGVVQVCGEPIGVKSKALISYLPERTYFDKNLTIVQTLDLFTDFYVDFDRVRAEKMLNDLHIDPKKKLKTLSKGTLEKVQLSLVMSRHAKLYLLDEPIGGVDPATRDYILHTIIANFAPGSSVLISTHLIHDVEPVLDDFLFIREGHIIRFDSVEHARRTENKDLDALFREVFAC